MKVHPNCRHAPPVENVIIGQGRRFAGRIRGKREDICERLAWGPGSGRPGGLETARMEWREARDLVGVPSRAIICDQGALRRRRRDQRSIWRFRCWVGDGLASLAEIFRFVAVAELGGLGSPVEAPEGTAGAAKRSASRMTSASTVGLPRRIRPGRAWT